MFYGVMCHLEEPASSKRLTKAKEGAEGTTAEREKVAWAVFLAFSLSRSWQEHHSQAVCLMDISRRS